MENNDTNIELTEQEKAFCELYVNGCDPYCGNASKCYEEVFQMSSNTSKGKARKLLGQKHIQEYLDEINSLGYNENDFLKKRLTEILLHIIDETSSAEFHDRRGTKLSPAPLRSVAVQATKALMEMYPIKEAQVNKLNIEGSGEGGVIFNVIVPEPKKKENQD